MMQTPHPTLLAFVALLAGVIPASAAAGDWHADMSYAATVWSDPTFWFEGADGRLEREGTLLDGGVVADIGWWATPWLSPLLQVAGDVERATWTSAYTTRDPTVLRSDLLGGIRFAPLTSEDRLLALYVDALVGAEVTAIPAGDPQPGARITPAAALTLGGLAGRSRTRALAGIRLRFDADPIWEAQFPQCDAMSCVSWSYSPGGSTVQVLLGAAFR